MPHDSIDSIKDDAHVCIAIAMQDHIMKTASLPSLRVEPELREAAESVLNKGETLSNFVENSVRAQIEYRRSQREFITRGLESRDEARRTGIYFDAADVHAELRAMLDAAKAEADQ
jgi:hypothetical protein